TNSLPVANHFGSDNSVEVLVTGGVIYPRLGVLVGPLAVESLSKMHADVAIMSGGGITLDGVTNSHALLIDIQRAVLQSAQRIIFCLDHTKFNRRSVSHLCELNAIDTIVTDAQADTDLVAELKQADTQVVIAN
ncbi:MAG TPA: DeoR/GlpR family DNA-binding transcription regulator, partial [Verrucomicrobiota bacterium]|nr:DeoR/GlpR family DNA-binding transcription regulator [Verrucomicrobiota bacterium]